MPPIEVQDVKNYVEEKIGDFHSKRLKNLGKLKLIQILKRKNPYIVSIKSGPHWGNSRQINKMKDDFKKAQRVLRSNNPSIQIVSINGCCYGRDNNPDKGDYFKYCGQKFWEFISDNSGLYVEIIEPLGHKAKEKNQEFIEEYSQIINKFTLEFNKNFCVNGKIDWNALVKFNSSITVPVKDF